MISHLFDANEHGDGGEKQDENKIAKKKHELRKKETEKQEVLVQRGMMDFMKNLLYSSFKKNKSTVSPKIAEIFCFWTALWSALYPTPPEGSMHEYKSHEKPNLHRDPYANFILQNF